MIDKVLEKRLASNKFFKFPNRHTQIFLSLLSESYDKILDVGCGKGYFTYVSAKEKKIKHSYGCDVYDEFQKDEIAPFVERAEYAQIENNILPFRDNEFDLVFSVDVIEHIVDDFNFVREKIRVCRSGGKVIIGTPNRWRIANIFLKIIGRLKYPRRMGRDTYGDVIHIREYSKKDLISLLQKENKINQNSLEIIPCWYGIPALNLGVDKMPRALEGICNFWFVGFNKK